MSQSSDALPIAEVNARTPLPWLVLVSVVFLGACASPGGRPPAALELPDHWEEATPPTHPGDILDDLWWSLFSSTELDALIERSLQANTDLSIATERVIQAELVLRQNGASLFPALELSASSDARAANTRQSAQDSSRVGLNLSYEIDLWGSNLERVRGSQAQLSASRHDLAASRLSVTAAVANLYAQTLALQARIEIATENLAITERLLQIVESRYRNGVASALDLSRQRSAVLSARDSIDPLRVALRQNQRALAILSGALPQSFTVGQGRLDDLTLPAPALLMPGELLLRRPDIAASEARLIAADANIALARAALLPVNLSIGISAAMSSSEFGFIGLGSPAAAATVGVSLLHAVFDGGRRQAQLELTESQQRELWLRHQDLIRTALKEVEDALSALQRAERQEAAQTALRQEAKRALRLAEVRYREGAEDLSALLDTQRSLFNAEESVAQARLARLTATVDLIKALGGGWRTGMHEDGMGNGEASG